MARDAVACELFRGGYARRIIELMHETRPEANCPSWLEPLADLEPLPPIEVESLVS